MIYNEEQKNRYIDYKAEGNRVYILSLKNVFTSTEPFENDAGKDVSTFTIEEIENMFKTLSYTSLNSLNVFKSQLYMYTNWALAEFLVPDSQNHFAEIKSSDLGRYLNANIIRKKVVSREQILGWCMQLPNPMDGFIILAFFEGIGGDNHREFTDLTSDDIDMDNHRIKLKGRGWREFSSELCNIGIEAAGINEYYSITNEQKRIVQLEQTNRIIKNYPNVKPDTDEFREGRRIYGKLKRALSYVGAEWLTAKDLQMSGVVDMVISRSAELDMKYDDYIRSEIGKSEIEYRYMIKDLRPQKIKILL